MAQDESSMAQDSSQPCVPIQVTLITAKNKIKSELGVTFFTRSCLVPLNSAESPILSYTNAHSIAAAGFLFAAQQQSPNLSIFRQIRAKDEKIESAYHGLMACKSCFYQKVGCINCVAGASSNSLFRGCSPPARSCSTGTCRQVPM